MDRVFIEVNGTSIVMCPVEAGSFMMGATVEQRIEAWDNEKPIRNVTLSPYYLCETVVTQAIWNAVMQEGDAGGNLPVTGKSWDEWQNFIARLNSLTGRRFRMPTEAEWENAARGGNKSRGCKYAGSNNINDVAWYDANSGSCVHPVMQKQPNELGLYDMTGNVFEWCFDKYGPYGEDPETDPTGSATGSQRVYRGGAFSYYQRGCRISCRFCAEPTGKDYSKIGLRLAMSEGNTDPYFSQGTTSVRSEGSKNTNPGAGSTLSGATSGLSEKRPSKGGKGQYWNNGKNKKKKLWPWFVGAGAVALIAIIILASPNREKEYNYEPYYPGDTILHATKTPITDRYVAGQLTYGQLDQFITGYANEFETNKESILRKYLADYSEGLGFINATNIALDDYRSWIMADSASDYSEKKGYLDRIDSLQNAFRGHIDVLLEVQEQTAKTTSNKSLRKEAQTAIAQLEEWKSYNTQQ